MPDPLIRFVDACAAAISPAAARDFPPFTEGLHRETPLNSAPYVFDPPAFRAVFGTTVQRRQIIDGCEEMLAALRPHGIVWHMLLIGGSFIRSGSTPSDLDGLLIYALDPAAPADVPAVLAGLADTARRAGVDLKLCPADVHPLVLVKRVIFFSNLFSYDRASRCLLHGTVMLVPGAMKSSADGAVEGCAP